MRYAVMLCRRHWFRPETHEELARYSTFTAATIACDIARRGGLRVFVKRLDA